VLDVVPRADVDAELAAWVEEQLAARVAARQSRDFATSDAIRNALREKGIEIEDGPTGTRWKKI
jgi:cysteinyl-tRNA synthetase